MRKLQGINQFASRYPILYHMAEEGSWTSISKHGLLSTTALLDVFEITGTRRLNIESAWRPTRVPITHPVHGTAVIRDQKPMPPDSLARVLKDGTPHEWYRFLNGKVFFWATEVRLNTLLNARLYRDKPHDVLTVDTQGLLEQYLDNSSLTHFNTGVSAFGPENPRNKDTFKNAREYIAKGEKRNVVELAVEYAVPDIVEFTISVSLRKGSKTLAKIWERR